MSDGQPEGVEVMTVLLPSVQEMNLKTNLKALMKRKGLTLSALARAAKVPKSSISDWTAGGVNPKVEHLKAVATALGTSVDELCFSNLEQENDQVHQDGANAVKTDVLGALVGDDWVSGVFEVKLRRLRRGGSGAEGDDR